MANEEALASLYRDRREKEASLAATARIIFRCLAVLGVEIALFFWHTFFSELSPIKLTDGWIMILIALNVVIVIVIVICIISSVVLEKLIARLDESISRAKS